MMQQELVPQGGRLDLRIGELVEVRSQAEIFATLDERGELEALPFMPEMLRFCGQQFRVTKLAIKLCDTINWSGMYRMDHAVHLAGVRCDGQAHGGCQAGCLVYWKEAWLKRVGEDDPGVGGEPRSAPLGSEDDLFSTTRKAAASSAPDEGEVFTCQATELLRAAPDFLPSWDLRQYVRDVRSGNASTAAAARSIGMVVFDKYQDLSRQFLPERLRLRGGSRFPFVRGSLSRTPREDLGLEPGELVRIKSVEEIAKTLDNTNRNRGMTFDREMMQYCGRQARVLRRVERIVNEKTGRMQHLKNPCIILDGVVCTSEYLRLCPRGVYSYWREIWLERV